MLMLYVSDHVILVSWILFSSVMTCLFLYDSEEQLGGGRYCANVVFSIMDLFLPMLAYNFVKLQ